MTYRRRVNIAPSILLYLRYLTDVNNISFRFLQHNGKLITATIFKFMVSWDVVPYNIKDNMHAV